MGSAGLPCDTGATAAPRGKRRSRGPAPGQRAGPDPCPFLPSPAVSSASSSTGSPARTPSLARNSLMCVTLRSAAARSGEVPLDTAAALHTACNSCQSCSVQLSHAHCKEVHEGCAGFLHVPAATLARTVTPISAKRALCTGMTVERTAGPTTGWHRPKPAGAATALYPSVRTLIVDAAAEEDLAHQTRALLQGCRRRCAWRRAAAGGRRVERAGGAERGGTSRRFSPLPTHAGSRIRRRGSTGWTGWASSSLCSSGCAATSGEPTCRATWRQG